MRMGDDFDYQLKEATILSDLSGGARGAGDLRSSSIFQPFRSQHGL